MELFILTQTILRSRKDSKGELFNYPELKEHIFKSSISYLEQFRILIGYEGPDLFVKDK